MVSRETKRRLEKRNQEIYNLRMVEGLSYRALARTYKLSKTAIGLILRAQPAIMLQGKILAMADAAIRSGESIEIVALNLPHRLALALEVNGIIRTDDLFLKGKRDFLFMRNIGPRSVKLLEALFIKYGKWSQKNWL
jgi:hypothetical protein